jgi:hypothetical protein
VFAVELVDILKKEKKMFKEDIDEGESKNERKKKILM